MNVKLASLSLFLMVTATTNLLADENWPQWRGPSANGTSDSTGLPVTWGPEEGIVCKTDLPAWSGGTPIIWGDRVFVTSPSKFDEAAAEQTQQAGGQGRRRGFGGRGFGGRGFGRRGGGGGGALENPGGQALMLICLSAKDGSMIWQKEVDSGNQIHRKQNNSSPSPVTDGSMVWTMTGNGVLVALDWDGNEVWKRSIQDDYGQFGLMFGYSSSPLLHEGKLFVQVLHGNNTDDPSYVLAIDAATGNVDWRVERPTDARRESPDSYTTPAVFKNGDQDVIVVSGGDYVTAHDMKTGAEVWRSGGLNPNQSTNYRIIASPVVVDQLLLVPSRKSPLLAIKAGGQGDITQSHRAWQWEGTTAPDVPTPVSDGTYVYMVNDQGIATCHELATGEVVWGPVRLGIGGTVSPSPVVADGKVYVMNEAGKTLVFEAGPEYKKLAENELDGTYTLSSMAIAGSHLFIRTKDSLYCIGQ